MLNMSGGNKLNNPEFKWDAEFTTFLDSLSDKEAVKLLSIIDKIEQAAMLTATRQEWVKKLEDNLYEVRVSTNSNTLREIYFQMKGSEYFITHGFRKNTNKTPKRELEKGRRLRNSFLNKNKR